MENPKHNQMIVAITAKHIPPSIQYGPSGVYQMGAEDTFTTLHRAGVVISRRGAVGHGGLEEDEAFRQVVPYVVVRRGEQILLYTRPGTNNESRLASKSSIGFGGHVELSDVVEASGYPFNIGNVVHYAAGREVLEEIGLTNDFGQDAVKGLLVVNDPGVDKVHIGVLYVVDAPEDFEPVLQADEIGSAQFHSLSELADMRSMMEKWSVVATNWLLSIERSKPVEASQEPVVRSRKRDKVVEAEAETETA